MARLSWSNTGSRFYESGIDRGVLYVGNQAGVAWPGLISVSESPSGGEARPYYIDGVKFLNLSSSEEFEATINAIYSPPEFGPCDGTASIQNGLFITQQPRKQFGFSYRTRIGNDIGGSEIAYKIHIIYNALAAPSNRDHKTLDNSAEVSSFSWAISTMPPAIAAYKRTAHFVIDSRTAIPFQLAAFEDILYGSSESLPRLPTAQELIDIFNDSVYSALKLVLVGTNTYEIHEVDVAAARAVMQSTPPVAPAIGEDPILWFDTSAGSYAIPKIVTGG